MRILPKLSLLFVAAAIAVPTSALAGKPEVLTGGENCGVGPSVDGDLAVAQDERSGSIAYYDLAKKQRYDTGIVEDGWAVPSMGGTKFAYFSGGYSTGYSVWVYDTDDGSNTPTPIADAVPSQWDDRPNRYFDGVHIAYWDGVAHTLKLYSLADASTVDLGIGWDVTVQDGYAVYATGAGIVVYDITDASAVTIGNGYAPAFGNDTVVYEHDTTGELMVYRLGDTAPTGTGLNAWDMYQWDADGDVIAFNIRGETIKVFDIKSGKLTDTGIYGCSGGDTCWIVVAGGYLLWERYEGGTKVRDPITGLWVEVNPEEDLDGDGTYGDCVILWIKI